jgi:hypothetical protein
MPLDRAPLTTLDAKRFLKPEPRAATAPSRDSTGRQGRKRSLASKRRIRLSKTKPSRGMMKPARKQPRVPAEQRAGARRHEDQDRSRTAHHLRVPLPARPKAPPTGSEGATAPLQEARLSARGRQFQGPIGASPEGTASQRTSKLVPYGPDFKTR